MCGIVGIFDTRGKRPIDRSVLERMNESQHHRGPDEGGIHLEPGVGLGHRRLSIIDLSSGQQPLYTEDKSVVVVYNGEIYNFRQLRSELSAKGYGFQTDCDTEVIVYAWQEWGEGCVQRFRGMFAFAIWDIRAETLFLARDRLGIKPLYYAILSDGMLVFASELKALLCYPGLPREIDPRAVEDYLAFGYVPDPKTIFRSVSKLAPGHTLSFSPGREIASPKQYWDVPFEPLSDLNVEEAGEQLITRLREAVEMRMIADVPLGAFLSGGVDSSAVVAMMAGLSNDPVKTCSISFGDPEFNEAEYANQVAQRYKTDHYVGEVDPDDYSLIDKLSWLYDEPFADSSAMPTYRVCELARKQVTVALSGDGGDENLAGYRRYRWHIYEQRVRSKIPQIIRGPLFGSLGFLYPKIDWAPKIFRAKSTLQALARDPIAGYLHSVSVAPDHLRKQLFSRDFQRQLQGYRAVEVLEAHARNAPSDPLSRVLYLDFKTYLPGDILTKVDRASMAHSLEVRVPLLDHKLVEWFSGLAPDLKFRGGEGKLVFKKSLENHLSKDILYRPKMGFAVPLSGWFRGPLRQRVRESLLGPTLQETEIFDSKTLETLVDQHQSGMRDHSATLWALLMFEAFQRNVMQGSG